MTCNNKKLHNPIKKTCQKGHAIQSKESTYAAYVNAVERHILPALGQLPMEQLTTDRLETFFRDKLINGRLDGKGGLSTKTVADLRGVMKLILEYARARELLKQHVELPKVGGYTFKIQTLSHTEQQKLEQGLFSANEPFALGVLLSLYTGLRIGEICVSICKGETGATDGKPQYLCDMTDSLTQAVLSSCKNCGTWEF